MTAEESTACTRARLNGFFYATLGEILERPFNDGGAR
jgi:hypothetical protein